MSDCQGYSENSSRLEREFKVASNLVIRSQFCKLLPPEVKVIFDDQAVIFEFNISMRIIRFDCSSVSIAARLFSVLGILSLAVCGLKESLDISFMPWIEIYSNVKQFTPRINKKEILKDIFVARINDISDRNN
jgi:hypothetical protein